MLSVRRLRELKIVQWAVAYLAGAWLVYQVTSLIGANFAWPPAVMRVLTVLLGVGLLITLVLAWYHGERGAQRVSVVELGMLASLFVLAGVAVAWVRTDAEQEVAATSVAAPPDSPAPERSSLAVLPFADLSPEGDQAYFADGLTEEILNLLAQLPGLRVAARTSSFAFRDSEVDIDSIARALRVGHVLEGSVRRAGGRLRVSVQLIDARTGFHTWSRRYDRDASDIFAVQDEIARAVAAQMRLRVGSDMMQNRPEETTDPEAHALVLQAAQVFVADSDEQRAAGLLREALARDPGYARAHANLGITYLQEAYEGARPVDEAVRLAREELARAFARDPDVLAGHSLAGMLAASYDWDWDRAEQHARRTLALNPANYAAYGQLGYLLQRLGRMNEALRLLERAVHLDPLSPQARGNLGSAYARAGRYDDAVRELRGSLRLDTSTLALGHLSMALADMGQHAAALQEARRLAARNREDWYGLAVLAYALARTGQRDEALRIALNLERNPQTPPFFVALAHALLRQPDAMFAWLERAVAQRDLYAPDLGITPGFAAYRSDPRMQRLLREMGLPDSPRPGAADG